MSFYTLPEPDTRPVEQQLREGFEAMQVAWEAGAEMAVAVYAMPPSYVEKVKALKAQDGPA